MNNAVNTDYDIVIIGGHLVGSLFACALENSSYRVAIIDSKDSKANIEITNNFDQRVFALNIASQRLFENLNLWQSISDLRAFPYHAMSVWDEASTGQLAFDCNDIASAALGYIVEEQVLIKVLHERLNKLTNTKCHFSLSLANIEKNSDAIHIEFEDQSKISTRLIVGADGQQSLLRTLAGISTHRGRYCQEAIVATVKVERSHQSRARQRFLKTGPLAFLPLSANTCSIVWSLDSDVAQEMLALSISDFEASLTAAFDNSLGQVSLLSERRAFPLNYLHASNYCQPRLALIGDAAHTMHPLAGQGVNLGFMDAAVLAEEIVDFKAANNSNNDPGKFSGLRRFERSRKGDNLLMLAAVGGFKKLFSSDFSAVRQIRGLGMNVFNKATWLKRKATQQAAGIQGELPKLARPLSR